MIDEINRIRGILDEIEAEREEAGDTTATHAIMALGRKRPPTGERVRFAGRRGPYGEILNVQDNPEGDGVIVVAAFEIDRLRVWLDGLEAKS